MLAFKLAIIASAFIYMFVVAYLGVIIGEAVHRKIGER